MTGVLLDHAVEPGSPEWLTRMSASKIAAAAGLSPYESPFSLWHKMAGTISAEQDKPELRRGHYLEPAIVAWFTDQHPDWQVIPAGRGETWVHKDRNWQAASPDGHIRDDREKPRLLEAKSENDSFEWGKAGTDQVPVDYRAQVMWQMDVLGIEVCHIPMLTAFLEFREYVVHYDPTEAAQLREIGWEFLESVREGREPALDGSTETYRALRELNPDIDRAADVQLPIDLAREFCDARAALAVAKDRDQHATSEVFAYMGIARRALFLDNTVATRQVRGEGRPYLKAARHLPDFTESENAA